MTNSYKEVGRILMDINVQHFIDAVHDDEVQQKTEHVSAADVQKKGLATLLNPLVMEVVAVGQAGKVAQTQLVIDTPNPTTIDIETGIVNVPIKYVDKIPQFLEPEEIVPMKIYLVLASEDLNRSGFHITDLGTAADFEAESAVELTKLETFLTEQLAFIATEYAKPKPEPEPAPAKKPAAKKKAAPKKRTTTRKRTTKKTTAKKAAK